MSHQTCKHGAHSPAECKCQRNEQQVFRHCKECNQEDTEDL